MKKYYLHNGSENTGPFDIEELRERKITKVTPIWFEGIQDWTTAGEIDELKGIIASIPPPIKKSIETPKEVEIQISIPKKKNVNWFRRVGLIIVGVFIIYVVLNIFANQNSNRPPSYEESVMTIAETEAAYPNNYLDAGGNYQENFLGDKLKIAGFIKNTATVTTYKDVVIGVTYYSKTKTELSTENYTIYEFCPPNTKIPFNLKVKNYSNVGSIGWNVVSAVVKN